MLKKTHHQDPVVTGHDVFGAVAVVHVKINNRHTLQAVPLQRVLGSDGDIVEKAESHGFVAAGMVTWRTHGAKSVFHLACNDCIGRGHGGSGTPQRRIPGVAVHGGVRVYLRIVRAARSDLVMQALVHAAKGCDEHFAVGQLNVPQGRQRGLAALQRVCHA